MHEEQIKYCKNLRIPSEKIAINRALRENIFVILVSLMNKIPVLLIGNPGNSKSLSIRMLGSNLRGKNSDSRFCKSLPELNFVYFQGSEACTSKGVEQIFDKVKQSKKEFEEKRRHKK